MRQVRALYAVTAAVVLAIVVPPAIAQCNPACQGDFNSDQTVTVDEIIIAVNNAIGGCGGSAEQQGCVASGGSVFTTLCCSGTPEFPNTCQIGTCGCAPQFSRSVTACDCGEGRCFNRTQRRCVP